VRERGAAKSVLTDYHTHLRPDDPGALPDEYFTESNVLRYLDAARARGILELGFSEHVHRFRQALEIWRHPFWEEYALDDLDAYVEFVQEMKARGHAVKLGIELDYVPGREEQAAALIGDRPWDYVIGSVHFIADRAVDHEGYDAWRNTASDEVWAEYFDTLGEAAASGLFDVIAHPDLVKVWGAGRPAPTRDARTFYEPAVERMARAGVAVEVSTAGLRKPVAEIYPAPALLSMCLEAGIPVALSSDAHEPRYLGYAYDRALAYLGDMGVDRICVFDRRRRREEPLG
jgi:histidinol-phosphatase (PHP family)